LESGFFSVHSAGWSVLLADVCLVGCLQARLLGWL
jgi:hypothetical protein